MSESELQESLERIAAASRARAHAEARMEAAHLDYQDAKQAFKNACKREQDVIRDVMTELPLFDRSTPDAL